MRLKICEILKTASLNLKSYKKLYSQIFFFTPISIFFFFLSLAVIDAVESIENASTPSVSGLLFNSRFVFVNRIQKQKLRLFGGALTTIHFEYS